MTLIHLSSSSSSLSGISSRQSLRLDVARLFEDDVTAFLSPYLLLVSSHLSLLPILLPLSLRSLDISPPLGLFLPHRLGNERLRHLPDRLAEEVALDGGDAGRGLVGDEVYAHDDAVGSYSFFCDLGPGAGGVA